MTPVEVMESVAVDPTGLVDQTTAFWEMLLAYQMEKLKKFGVAGKRRKPAAKTDFGERRVLFHWVGVHGESLMVKLERRWAEDVNGEWRHGFVIHCRIWLIEKKH